MFATLFGHRYPEAELEHVLMVAMGELGGTRGRPSVPLYLLKSHVLPCLEVVVGAAPETVEIEARGLDSIVVRWTPHGGREGSAITGYKLRVEYFDPHGPMIDAFWATEQEADKQDTAKAFQHPDGARCPGGLRACTVRAAVTAMGGAGSRGDTTTCNRTWDSQQSVQDGLRGNLELHSQRLEQACQGYCAKRGRSRMTVLVIGGQHHGKSSFVNHLKRCLSGRADAPDEMETAPAGPHENMHETNSLVIPFGALPFQFRFTLTAEAGQALEAPDAAIVVLSLMHWASMKNDMKEYLKQLSDKFKNASGGKVAFPFAVAVTKRDEFLRETQAQRPYEALQRIVEEIKECANTENVHVLSNMQETSYWSEEVNEATFRLLSNVVTFAKNQDTASAKKDELMPLAYILVPFLFFATALACLVADAGAAKRRP